ncbi:hypothetical protein FHX49_001801 [Microbacterium endophyticum]|uniref:Phage holin family protein n=1 Tax=Microbacterium endophyticum TaxID=1526412 RepID=A0A7W4V3M1_9MICO|nr:hypothetical protein [Microbacterium endophyticum]MBB2976227.1 hypothetical protein [Microbacterium endophyticum]NIK35107.1 hypothetical protein [Microbacterium endophyticum]
MVTFLIRSVIFIASAAVGLIAADLILPGFTIDWRNWWPLVLCVLIFAVLQSVLAPWIAGVARRNAPALLGGIGIISTLVSLIIVIVLPIGGLEIGEPYLLTWILAPVIVWVVTAIATLVLPLLLLRDAVKDGERHEKKKARKR